MRRTRCWPWCGPIRTKQYQQQALRQRRGSSVGVHDDVTSTELFRNDLKSSGNMIDPSKLIDASGTLDNPLAPDRCYADRKNGVVVQVWENATPGCDGTPWAGTLRVSIKHTSAKTPEQYEKRRYSKPITWDDMQAIKDWFWPNRIAVEVFPPKANVVNVADMRWMWVLPQGAVLPFNLQGSSVERLVS